MFTYFSVEVELAEITERELAIYGFSSLVWTVLALTETSLFVTIGVDKASVIMTFFWISMVLFILGIAGIFRKHEGLYKVTLGASVVLGIIGLIAIGVVGYKLIVVI